MMRKSILVLCLGLMATAPLFAANKEQKRLANAGVVMQEIMNTPENIPQEVLEKAECVIVFPSVLKGAFIVGASYGRGAMVCRSGRAFPRTLGRSGDDGAGRRELWIPNRRTSDGSRPAHHESQRRAARFLRARSNWAATLP